MAFEKAWSTVSPTPLTADGSTLGVIQVADTINFKVKGLAQLTNTSGLNLVVQVNQVLNSTTIIVGKPGSSPSATAGGLASGAVVDVSAFTVAGGSTIGFGMQPKNKIKPDDVSAAIYETDPVIANRNILVDPYGEFYTSDNPLPATFTGTISIGEVEIKGPNGDILVVNPDGSINTDTEIKGSTGNILEPNVDGSINVEIARSIGLFNLEYDSIQATYPNSTTENYQSYLGGLSGTPVQLVVVIYTDATKNFITSVVRTPTG
jgi:hypothetical protein